MGRSAFTAAIIAGGMILSSPALADVKAGVDAWTRGDYAVAIKEWQGPAVRGDADAQFNLGQAFKLGRGVPQDLVQAERLFGQAAARGHLQAADNYGLLLFQRGQREQALPYIKAAAERGDPRAQYLLGVAHFNGDIVAKDWVRAYALVNLARQSGLDQAKPALTQMDQFIPIEQRQQGVALASEMAIKAEAARAQQLAAVDLGSTVPSGAVPAQPAVMRPSGATPSIASAETAVASATRAAGGESPRTAGADFARPGPAAIPIPVPVASRPVPLPTPDLATRPPAARPAATQPAATQVASSAGSPSGPWRVQLGAFGVSANADAAWNRVKSRPELAGKQRFNARSGNVIRLQAGGFASEAAAKAACARLTAAGNTCITVRN